MTRLVRIASAAPGSPVVVKNRLSVIGDIPLRHVDPRLVEVAPLPSLIGPPATAEHAEDDLEVAAQGDGHPALLLDHRRERDPETTRGDQGDVEVPRFYLAGEIRE